MKKKQEVKLMLRTTDIQTVLEAAYYITQSYSYCYTLRSVTQCSSHIKPLKPYSLVQTAGTWRNSNSSPA